MPLTPFLCVASGALVLALTAVGCFAPVHVRVRTDWGTEQANLGGILVLPIVATDDDHEALSGARLDRATREQLGEAACRWFRETRPRTRSVCYPGTNPRISAAEELMKAFAQHDVGGFENAGSTTVLTREVRNRLGTRYFLLMRPEMEDGSFAMRSGNTRMTASQGSARTTHTIGGSRTSSGNIGMKWRPTSYKLTVAVVDAKRGLIVWQAEKRDNGGLLEPSDEALTPEDLASLRELMLDTLSKLPE